LKIALQQNLLDGLKGNLWIFILSVVLIFPITIVISSFGADLRSLIAIVAFPAMLLFLFNFRVIYSINILLLFGSAFALGFSWAVLFVTVLVVSFIINYKNIDLRGFSNPLIFPFLFYLILCIPSLLYTDALGDSLYEMFNLVAFAIIILLSVASIKRVKELKIYITVFLLGALINGIYLIFEGIMTQQRAFGFSGVMYVDYAGIAFIISLVLFLLSEKFAKAAFGVLVLTFLVTTLFNQTRGIWLVIIITASLLIIYLIIKSSSLQISKKFLITVLIFSVLILSVGVLTIQTANPNVFERSEEFAQTKKDLLTEEGKVTSSLVSRFFIWHTAANAFLENPWTGVGMYAFPYVSQKYYELPDFLFELYVEGKTPHTTYFAVLTETGIMGFVGFLIFILYIIKTSFANINLAKTKKERMLALVLTWTIVYITISMLVTDAWLWQRGIISWGMFIGMNLAYRKLLLLNISEHNTVKA
jgi:O-antigen ligase